MKYIFIDSNQYRHLFSKSEGFSDSVFDLLKKLAESNHTVLILPQQTKDEVERNRFRGWPEAETKRIKGQIEKIYEKAKKFEETYGGYKSSKKLAGEILKESLTLKSESDLLSNSFTNLRSKANKKVIQLFSLAKIIKENDEIIRKAEMRYQKGNPPYDSNGFGDSIIWESIIGYLKSQQGRRKDLIFVTNDKIAWGDGRLDPWLNKEYKQRVRGEMHFISRLSDIPDLTTTEQKKIREEEQTHLKNNALTDFINSNGWAEAGKRAWKLLTFKDLLNGDDYEEILKASITNSQIYGSFTTPDPLRALVTGDDGYVSRTLETVDKQLWTEFASKNSIGIKRHSDEEAGSSETVNSTGESANVEDNPPF